MAGLNRDHRERLVVEGNCPIDVADHGVEHEVRHDAQYEEPECRRRAEPACHGTREENCRTQRNPDRRQMGPVKMVMRSPMIDQMKVDHVEIGKNAAQHACRDEVPWSHVFDKTQAGERAAEQVARWEMPDNHRIPQISTTPCRSRMATTT